MKHLLICGMAAGAFAVVSSVQGVETGLPYAAIISDGMTIPVDVFLMNDNENYGFRVNASNSEWEVTGNGVLKIDPSIVAAIAVVDLGAPSTFSFLFFTPIVATGPATLVDASIVGGLADATGDGVSITPSPGATVQSSEVGLPLTNMGVDVGPAFAGGTGVPGAFFPYGSYSAGPISGPAGGPWTTLSLSMSFTLSGNGDTAALTGFAQVVDAPRTVPDSGPGLAVLFGGWLVLVFAARRRTQQAI